MACTVSISLTRRKRLETSPYWGQGVTFSSRETSERPETPEKIERKKAVTRYVSQRNGVTARFAVGRWLVVFSLAAGLVGQQAGVSIRQIAVPSSEQGADTSIAAGRFILLVRLLLFGEPLFQEP